MAITVSARYPGLSPQLYDEVVATLDLDANPPIGAILHLAGQSDDGIQVTEIWRTEQAFQAFNDRFVSALQMRGYLSRPTIETAQLTKKPVNSQLPICDCQDREAWGLGVGGWALTR